MASYLTGDGLRYLWSKIAAAFASVQYVNGRIGEIDVILDQINGRVKAQEMTVTKAGSSGSGDSRTVDFMTSVYPTAAQSYYYAVDPPVGKQYAWADEIVDTSVYSAWDGESSIGVPAGSTVYIVIADKTTKTVAAAGKWSG